MRTAILLATSCLAALCFAEIVTGKNGYTGLRVSVKKSAIEAMHHEAYKAMASKLATLTWPDLNDTVGSPPFTITFLATGLTTIGSTYDAKKLNESVMEIDDHKISLNFKGDMLTITQSFSYDLSFFGMHIFFGKGQAILTTKYLNVVEVFAERSISTSFDTDWTITPTVDGLTFFGFLNKWVVRVFEDHYDSIDQTMSSVFAACIADQFKPWTDIKVSFYPETNALNVLLQNKVLTMNEQPAGYVTFGYRTYYAVEDRLQARDSFKVVNREIKMRDASIYHICLSPNVLPDITDIQGRTSDFIFPLDPTKLSLQGKVRDLMNIMPRLVDNYDPEEPIYIGCQSVRDDSIVRIRDSYPNGVRFIMQIPFACQYGVTSAGKTVLATYGFIRANVTKGVSASPAGFSVKGRLVAPTLYSFKVTSALYAVENLSTLRAITGRIVHLLEGFDVVAPSVKVEVGAGIQAFAYIPGEEEDCFSFI